MKPRKLIVTGTISEKMVGDFIVAFKQMDSKRGQIDLIISSAGGGVDAGSAMYEIIRTSNNPVTTVGVGLVASIAVLIFEAGDYRVATEGTNFLLHDYSLKLAGSLEAIKSATDEADRSHKWYCEQISQRTKMPFQKVLKLASKESYMTAQEAKKLRLLDDIIPYRPFAKLTKGDK